MRNAGSKPVIGQKNKKWGSNNELNSYAMSQRSASIVNTENNEPVFLQTNNNGLLSVGNNQNPFSNSSRSMSD